MRAILLETLSTLLLLACQSNMQEGSNSLLPDNSFTTGIEGPTTDRQGNLYVVNYQQEGTIGKIYPDGKTERWLTLPEGSVGNSLQWSEDSCLLVADYTKHKIWKINRTQKTPEEFAYDSLMHQPNDLAVWKNNILFASDPNWKNGSGQLWRIEPDCNTVLLEKNMGTTNGIEISPDGKKLYVNESVQRRIWVYEITDKGNIKSKTLFHQFEDGGLDGMKCDAEGNLYIARYDKKNIVVLNPEGKKINTYTLIGKKPTNLVFGGKDGKTLFITLQDRGTLEYFQVPVPGKYFK